jgi:transposase-like protein
LFEARFKEEAVRRMLNGESIMRLSRELDVARAVLYRWRDTYRTSRRARGNEPSGI